MADDDDANDTTTVGGSCRCSRVAAKLGDSLRCRANPTGAGGVRRGARSVPPLAPRGRWLTGFRPRPRTGRRGAGILSFSSGRGGPGKKKQSDGLKGGGPLEPKWYE